jgi:hypothetical protein
MIIRIASIAVIVITMAVGAATQNGGDSTKNFFGLNIGHALVINSISRSMDTGVSYMPIHIQYNRSISRNFGVSGVLVYRLDKSDGVMTNEFGFGIGPCFMPNGIYGFFADCKIGLGFAFGKDGLEREYSRTDFLLQPELGYFIHIGKQFAMCFGLGMQSLILISEDPPRHPADALDWWDWNSMGKLSHYYLPVLNISFGFAL